MFRCSLILLAFIVSGCSVSNVNSNSSTSSNVNLSTTPYFKFITPSKHTRWQEGKDHKISWNTNIQDKLCIEAALGAHPLGLLNNCDTPSQKGYFIWHIDKNRITGFGQPQFNNVRVAIYPKNNPNSFYKSEFFTVYK